MAAFVAILDRILVRPHEPAVSEAGIIVPTKGFSDRFDRPAGTLTGEVVMVGGGKRDNRGKRQAMTVSVGDNVCFYGMTGVPLGIDGETMLVMKDEDILGVIE